MSAEASWCACVVCIGHLMQLTFVDMQSHCAGSYFTVGLCCFSFMQTPNCNQNQPIWNFYYIFFSGFALAKSQKSVDDDDDDERASTMDEFSFSLCAIWCTINAFMRFVTQILLGSVTARPTTKAYWKWKFMRLCLAWRRLIPSLLWRLSLLFRCFLHEKIINLLPQSFCLHERNESFSLFES